MMSKGSSTRLGEGMGVIYEITKILLHGLVDQHRPEENSKLPWVMNEVVTQGFHISRRAIDMKSRDLSV